MSRWPFGGPLDGIAATVGCGGADALPPAPPRPRAGHGLRALGERLRVREAVGAAETLRRRRYTRAAGRRSAGDRRLRSPGRQRPSMREYCSWDSYWWVREGSRWRRRPCRRSSPWSPGRIEAGRIQPGKVFPGAWTLRPWTSGSCSGSLTNSASCWVSGCTSPSSTTAGAAWRYEPSTKEFPVAESTPCVPQEQHTVASPSA